LSFAWQDKQVASGMIAAAAGFPARKTIEYKTLARKARI
jgi:hypothetical protein